MKLRIGGLMLALCLLVLSMTAFGGGLRKVLAREISRPVAAVAPAPLPYAPQVVAKVMLKGQTRQIPQTRFFTTPSDGLFRISAYMVATAASNGDELGFSIYYTDEVGPTSQGFAENLAGPGCSGALFPTACSWVSTVRAVAGSTISYSQFGSGNVTYDLFFTLERLD